MANKDNQSKQYRIYIKESKSWVDVNKEFYTNYYRDINAYRKRQQEHGRCVCPASKRYLCDMDCMTCPYVKAGDQLSLDNTVSDGEGNEKSWLDDMPLHLFPTLQYLHPANCVAPTLKLPTLFPSQYPKSGAHFQRKSKLPEAPHPYRLSWHIYHAIP